MNLQQALRLSNTPCLALTGAGGKTTALFQLAHELAPAVVTTTTHLGLREAPLADRHIIVDDPDARPDLEPQLGSGVTLVTGPVKGDRLTSLDISSLEWLHAICNCHDLPLLIEADGSRGCPLKAPADYEPVIPSFVKTVVVAAGLSGLGKALTDEFVHRPGIFARLSGHAPGEPVTPGALTGLLTHPAGGLKNIPCGARRVALLNQADTPELQAQAAQMAKGLLETYDTVLIASLQKREAANDQRSVIHAVHECVAGIILAAGESSRFGSPKQLLDYHGRPFVRQVAETALAAGLSPIVVVTGAYAERVEAAVHDLPLTISHNPNWQSGQSSSLQAGLRALTSSPLPAPFGGASRGEGRRGEGAAIFLLADQPQIPTTVLRALVERHSLDLSPIVAPQVRGQRANPVLFDRTTFPALLALTGDTGGRAIFNKFPVTYLPWHDENLLTDVDTPADYEGLSGNES